VISHSKFDYKGPVPAKGGFYWKFVSYQCWHTLHTETPFFFFFFFWGGGGREGEFK
jgi:hypothetical protein